MPEPIRLFSNYNGRTLTALDKNTLEEFTFGWIPMRLFWQGGKINLTNEVWENIADFESGKPTGSKFNKSFSINLADARTKYGEFVTPIETASLEWLEVSPTTYKLEMLDINLTNLKIRAKAVHKTNKGKVIEDETDTLEEFEQVKADYPELVVAYFALQYKHAKENSTIFAKFN